MGMTKAGIITLLLVLGIAPLLASAACPAGIAKGLAPAVMGETGQMLELTVESRPGDGQVYISANPYVGMATQNSERVAASIASQLLGINASECDFFLRIGGNLGAAEAVDGPSAGAAMTILAISALSNATILQNLSITGTIEPDGSIGSVGGVSTKAKAVAESGGTVFITPRLTMYERLLLDSVRKKWNLTVVEARDIVDASLVAFAKEPPNESRRDYKGTVVPGSLQQSGLPTGGKFSRFQAIAEQTLQQAGEHVQAALAQGNGEFDDYFKGELNASRVLLGKGYLYSAANLAFLTRIDASVLEKSPTVQEVEKSRAETAACVYGVQKPELTAGNYEEVFGGEQRMAWARKKLAGADGVQVDGEDTAVFVLNELEYAQSWCSLAKSLYSAPPSGMKIDEGALAQLALVSLNRSTDSVPKDNLDATWHAEAAQEAYGRGDYGAAIYDSTYAYASVLADGEMGGKLPAQIAKEADALNAQNTTSLWPALYRSHSRYYAADDGVSSANAFRLAMLADQLDKMQKQIDGIALAEKLPAAAGAGTNKETSQEGDFKGVFWGFMTLAALGAILVLAYEILLMLRRR
jgi:predicted S18 family serine protease